MKKYLAILSFLILNSTVFASTVGGSIGGWQVVSNVASGIGAKITATKDVMVNGAKTTLTGTANIMPNPSNMGKFMLRLGGAAVVSEALNQILDGVDYVMDPANNTVQYKKENSETQVMPYHKYHWYDAYSNRFFASAKHVCSLIYSRSDFTLGFTVNAVSETKANCMFKQSSGGTLNYATVTAVPNPAYNPVADQNNKVTVPLNDVASAVIGQAEEDIRVGNPASPAVAATRAVAQDMIQEAEADDVKARPIATELDKNTSYPSDTDVEGEITTPEQIDPVTGEVVKPSETSSIAMQFPKACEWLPQLCVFIDWMQKPHEIDEPDLPTKEIEKKEIDEELVKISSSSCPAPIDVNIPLPVFNTTYTDSISVSEYCPKIEKLAPVLQLLAFVLAIMIIKDI